MRDVDVIMAVVDATAAIGPGTGLVPSVPCTRSSAPLGTAAASGAGGEDEDEDENPVPGLVVVVNKVDRASEAQALERLTAAKEAVDALADLEAEYFPGAGTGRRVDVLVADLIARLPEGPPFFPADVVTDTPEALWVAELVRE